MCTGGIYSASSSFDMVSSRVLHNTVLGGNCGGAAILRCESGHITRTNMSFNSALSGPTSRTTADGGALCIELSSLVLVEQSTFESNVASSSGGGVVIKQSPNVTVRHAHFLSNHAANGGSMSVQESPFVNISDMLLTNSSAMINGGGIEVRESPALNVQNSRFMGSYSIDGFGSSIWSVIVCTHARLS